MHFTSGNITTFLLSLSIMLLSAKLLGELFNKIGQPAVVGEIIAGIILGPTVFGWLMPQVFTSLFPTNNEVKIALDGIVNLAVILLLLVSGLEVDLSVIVRERKSAFLTGAMGIIIPFILGFAVSLSFPYLMGLKDESMKMIFAIFMGTALSISALPVIAKTLMDLNMFKTNIGHIIIAAAMFNDLIGWLIFSVILSLIGASNHGLSVWQTILLVLVFTIFILLIVRKLFNLALPWVQKKFSYPGGVLNFILILGFLGAAFTEYIGIHAIFGAFIVGIAVGDSVHIREQTKEVIQQFITNIFAPLFFVSIGLRINFITNFDPVMVIIILVLAFAGKIAGCTLGARLSSMKANESFAIGFGMNSRGTMEIILGLIALQYGLIHANVFVALVIMAIITSISSAPFMKYFLRAEESLSSLLKPDFILFTDIHDKKELIGLLVNAIGHHFKINKTEILDEVLKREDIIPTGIANYLAIPHARININKPVIAAAINKQGIDFEAEDKIPSQIIFLLLTPKDKNELQLKLLADIVKLFKDKDRAEKILSLRNKEQVIGQLKLSA